MECLNIFRKGEKMGIYIVLKNRTDIKIPLRETVLDRVHYAEAAIRFFYNGRIFNPTGITIWKGRPSETLGGEKVGTEIKITDFPKDLANLKQQINQFQLEQLLTTVIQIEGDWDINGHQLAGFFSINNNSSWRDIYRDIEIDAYGRGEIEDLVDAIWKTNNGDSFGTVKRLISSLDNAEINQKTVPSEVFFTIGVPSIGYMKNLRAIHCQGRRSLIRFMYSTMNEEGEEEVKEKLGPMNKGFFVGAIVDEPIAIERFQKALQETLMIEDFGGSVTYFASDPESFTKLYEKFYETVFRPAFKKLPRAKDVKKNITEGLTGQSQLPNASS
jgi:hypothetical protein